ncbi:aromatic acid exporter family protein [Alkalihalobacterium chitinilyticum]|uniref:Aromatic acid exporter family protein n=1 Tax=Alkalihalobacterium chitinilyticum TaxID=2980103 RepID=A0ABT5VA90_9BACI|nr:aromatic acid exporter family protein [Alkalihalobacterium chitinilyticum]MDE5412200.1 aromatic acid exporter family protein [Alkalihalobacterium chitinilyticum]
MFKIGYRTLKTAVGAGIAIAIAQWLSLDFYASAAILTILCISVTRRSSVSVSWQRFVGCLLGLVLAFILFEWVGYHPISLIILLLVFIPLSVKLKVKEGIVTSCVIILHIYTLGTVSVAIFLNELYIIIIGIGVALLMNLYMPSVDRDLHKYQKRIEDNFKFILKEFSNYLRNSGNLWDGKELTETYELIQDAKDIAIRNIENHLLRYEDQYYHYFKMREKQFEIIERIMPFISSLDDTVVQGIKISSFLEELSQAVGPVNTASYFLDELSKMREEFQQMELPQTRQEFEIRSSLYYVMHELEKYLLIKESLRKQPVNK